MLGSPTPRSFLLFCPLLSETEGHVFGFWPKQFTSSFGLEHSCIQEGAPGMEWVFQDVCFSWWPHRAEYILPWVLHYVRSPTSTSPEKKPGTPHHLSSPCWKAPRPLHPSTPTRQPSGRQGGQGHRAQSRLTRPCLLSLFHLDLGFQNQGRQFPSQDLAPRKTYLPVSSSLLFPPSSSSMHTGVSLLLVQIFLLYFSSYCQPSLKPVYTSEL